MSEPSGEKCGSFSTSGGAVSRPAAPPARVAMDVGVPEEPRALCAERGRNGDRQGEQREGDEAAAGHAEILRVKNGTPSRYTARGGQVRVGADGRASGRCGGGCSRW